MFSEEIIFFLFSCYILGYNEQELFYGNTLRINGKERKELTFIECLVKVWHGTINCKVH